MAPDNTWKFRVDAGLVRDAIATAQGEGEDLSSILRGAMRAYIADPKAFSLAVAKIRLEAKP